MEINVIKGTKPKQREPFGVSTPLDRRCGFWATVTEVHPEDCTVHVRMDNGQIITGVRVASLDWVTVDKERDYLTGERHLPPVDTFVFCMMPNGEISSAFVLCSGFAYQQAVHAQFKKKGEDAEKTWEHIDNSGWKDTTDYRTGTKKFFNRPNGDETISATFDQEGGKGEEWVKVIIHGTELTVNKDGIKLKTDGTVDIEVEKDKTAKYNSNVKRTVKKNAETKVEGDVKARSEGKTDVESVKDFTLSVNDGLSTVKVGADGKISIAAPAGIAIDTPQITVTGGITTGGDVVAGSVSLQKHTHTGVHGITTPPN